MTLTNQAKKVLALIERDGHLTRLTAMHYGIANITARITELRDAGYPVVCALAKDADGSRYGRWSLSKSVIA
jgi:hypothetical protein